MASVSIPSSVYERVSKRVDHSEFDSVDDYVTFVLEEVLNQLEGENTSDAGDRNEVMDKLRDLGYLE